MKPLSLVDFIFRRHRGLLVFFQVTVSVMVLCGEMALAHPLVFGDPDGGTRPQTAAQVSERLQRVESFLPANDGIARFNHLYQATTGNITKAIDAGFFENAALMQRFVVKFANLYFNALSAHFSGKESPPRAWRPLFENRNFAGQIRALRFTMAGMNAHISRDLPVALEQLFESQDQFPELHSQAHRDYIKMNDVLNATFEQLKDELFGDDDCEDLINFATDLLSETGAVPAIIIMRHKAWLDGRILWRRRHSWVQHGIYLASLDWATATLSEALIGRGI